MRQGLASLRWDAEPPAPAGRVADRPSSPLLFHRPSIPWPRRTAAHHPSPFAIVASIAESQTAARSGPSLNPPCWRRACAGPAAAPSSPPPALFPDARQPPFSRPDLAQSSSFLHDRSPTRPAGETRKIPMSASGQPGRSSRTRCRGASRKLAGRATRRLLRRRASSRLWHFTSTTRRRCP